MREEDRSELVEWIRREVDLYEQLLSREQGRLDLLLYGKPEEILLSSTGDGDLLQEIKACEQKIHTLVSGVPLMETARHIGHPHRTVLEPLLRRFRQIVVELRRVNLQNFRYLQNSLDYTRCMMQACFGSAAGYDNCGILHSDKNPVASRSLKWV